MNKLTKDSAILRSEVKTQVEFDLLVAVARASGIPLESQSFESSDYRLTYLTFTDPRHGITQTHEIVGMPRTLISFEDAVFSLAKPEWTHIWRGDLSEEFLYGDSNYIYFTISRNKAYNRPKTKCYTLIATREPVAVAPPKPKFKAGDVLKHNYYDTKHTILFIDEVSAVVESCDGSGRRHISTNELCDYEKVIPLREQLASLITSVDDDTYYEDIADAILEKFNVTEKS